MALGIPDLTSGFTKAYNQKIKHAGAPNNQMFNSIHFGIRSHFEADKKFHSSPLFMQQVRRMTNLFVAENLDRNRLRLSVIAHIAIEFLLDRQILLADKYMAEDYYNKISEADTNIISAYFDEMDMKLEKQDFLSKFQFHKEKRFLYLFDDMQNIVQGLVRVYQRVTGVFITEPEQIKMETALYNIEKEMRYTWQQTLNV